MKIAFEEISKRLQCSSFNIKHKQKWKSFILLEWAFKHGKHHTNKYIIYYSVSVDAPWVSQHDIVLMSGQRYSHKLSWLAEVRYTGWSYSEQSSFVRFVGLWNDECGVRHVITSVYKSIMNKIVFWISSRVEKSTQGART